MVPANDRIVTVLGQEVRIEHVVNLLVEGERCEGGCYVSERLIKISDEHRAGEARYNRILIHEMVHMILGISGVSEMMTLPTEEAVCVVMESAGINFDEVDKIGWHI
jgi:hypothetical protein